jgi:hypothetical protein
LESKSTLAIPPAGPSLVPLFLFETGVIALSATHTQIDTPLVETLAALANQGERVALLVADSDFDGHALARRLNRQESVKLSFAETPYQVRFLVRRLLAARGEYSIVVIVGLLETFQDEQIKLSHASLVLQDTLMLLDELARTLRVMVILTPPGQETRPQLLRAVQNVVAAYLELPALPTPKDSQGRLF